MGIWLRLEDTDMSKLLVFSGTGDGRILAEMLADAGHSVVVCVATEYGEQLMPEHANIRVHCGRMDEAHMHAFMSSCGMDAVIDGTHPYATAVSENIQRVCKMKNYKYYRLLRDSFSEELENVIHKEDVIYAKNTVEAAEIVEKTEGNIFLSTGSKELPVFVENISNKERIFARVLPSVEVLEEANRLGVSGKQLICMQGPFSEQLNYGMFVQTKAKILVTKESGSAGGFMEKIKAARKAGMKIVIIKRPGENGVSAEYILREFNAYKNKPQNIEEKQTNQKITLVGIGMGSEENMTREAYNACKNATLLIGAERMLTATGFNCDARKVHLYQSQKIVDEIENAQERNIVVVLSGDTGFYSGAKKLAEELEKRGHKEIEILPGISSVVYLASKAKISWDDMVLVSLHGRECNIVNAVKHNEKVFTLLGGTDNISSVCKQLCHNNLGNVKIFIGTNLSYENEIIIVKTANELCNYKENGISAAIIINENPDKKNTTHGISDEEFIRDKTPMTKEEVRCISLSKLQLKENSVVYDIGAGSGSVTVECAMAALKGKIYAIERKDDAISLIKKNCEKFAASNVEIIKGYAPDFSEEINKHLQPPTHAFIGGSGGNLGSILDWLREKNDNVRVVINAIALETVTEIISELKKRKIENPEIVCVNVSKAKKIGQYNMMMGNNPVYIVSFNLQ